jgi:protease-4
MSAFRIAAIVLCFALVSPTGWAVDGPKEDGPKDVPQPVKPPTPVPGPQPAPNPNPIPRPGEPEPKPAAPTTKPSSRPSAPSTRTATTEASTDGQFPSPAELMEKIKARQSAFDKLPKVAHIDLNEPLMEKSPEFTLFGDDHILTVHNVLNRLRQARDDKSLRAVLITFSGNTEFNTAQAQEIRSALGELRKAGKRTFVYADTYDTATYLAAIGATDVCLLEGGEIMIPGVGLETMFFKGLFDKFGVQADFVQIGEYKGADESYTRTEPSPESRGELNKIVDSLYELIVDTIATSRNVTKASVKQMIDDSMVTAQQAKDRKLIDHLISADDVRDLLKGELGGGGDVNVLGQYAVPQREKFDFSNPLALLTQMTKKHKEADARDAIALIHAEGVIVDGEDEDGLLGPSGNVGSENIRKAFRMAARDQNVKAIVLRIDSPGGSALASEVMWQAVQKAAADKPVIVSIGSMAASGGYYLASAGDYIFADSSAIVGSIGVVGGKFVLSGLFEKLGISTESFTRGKNADLFSMDKPWTDRQRRLVTNWMKNTYEQFTERVMTMRKDRIKDIDQVARGRIFLAKQAKELGMVDEIGGLSEAIKHAAEEAQLEEYDVKSIPGSYSLIDYISGNVDESMFESEIKSGARPRIRIEVKSDSVLQALPASARRMIGRQLQFMKMLEKRPVMLVAPYTIRVK